MTKLLGGDDIRIRIEYASIYDDLYSFDGSVHANDDDVERAAALYRQVDALRAEIGNLHSQLDAHANRPSAVNQKQ
ncbi:hypothetical protein [Paraburkholderia sp. SIMBA_027]|uniref:hypothetical protein n=1 Tax=Paraburkholderia sp. SIMBA_027 TaxID=3085770 RepID=UPI00397CA795